MRINLALQGGGAHGAFTWGVLDRLLEEPGVEIAWISGTSAGAVNAAAVASGLAVGGPSAARMTLRRVWEAVLRAGPPDLARINPFLSGIARATSLTGLLSPYDVNPLGLDPLRQLLSENIDFAAIAERSPVELLIAATDVETGRAHIFRRTTLRVEHVLASACLPTLHHAVEIEGRAYWDGGFSANPDLVTLARESPCKDTLIVELNPRVARGTPRLASDIAARVAAITFNQPFLRDIQMIVAAQEATPGLLGGKRDGAVARLRAHRFHLVEADRYTAPLGQESKVQLDGKMLAHLFEAGRSEASLWLERHGSDVGTRSSVALAAIASGPEGAAAGAAELVKRPGSVAPFLGRPGRKSRGP